MPRPIAGSLYSSQTVLDTSQIRNQPFNFNFRSPSIATGPTFSSPSSVQIQPNNSRPVQRNSSIVPSAGLSLAHEEEKTDPSPSLLISSSAIVNSETRKSVRASIHLHTYRAELDREQFKVLLNNFKFMIELNPDKSRSKVTESGKHLCLLTLRFGCFNRIHTKTVEVQIWGEQTGYLQTKGGLTLQDFPKKKDDPLSRKMKELNTRIQERVELKRNQIEEDINRKLNEELRENLSMTEEKMIQEKKEQFRQEVERKVTEEIEKNIIRENGENPENPNKKVVNLKKKVTETAKTSKKRKECTNSAEMLKDETLKTGFKKVKVNSLPSLDFAIDFTVDENGISIKNLVSPLKKIVNMALKPFQIVKVLFFKN